MPRIEWSRAFDRVVVRGDQKQLVCRDPAEFRKDLLNRTADKNRTGSRMLAHVLMRIHVCLRIATGEIPLSTVTQGIIGGFPFGMFI